MKPAHEDLLHRRPVWEALSDLFLDTDTDTPLARSWRVGVLAASPYSIGELQEILVNEVYPICRANLSSVAGEWAGLEAEWLERSILRHLRAPRCWRWLSLGRFTVPLSLEWRQTKAGVIRQRSQSQARNVAP